MIGLRDARSTHRHPRPQVRTDPGQHNAIIAERQMFWTYFDATTHVTKAWSEVAGLDLHGVAVELLVLRHMPRPRWLPR
jgi:hypothetical protein